MRHAASLVLACTLACSPKSTGEADSIGVGESSATTETSETGAGLDTSDTGDIPCDPDVCMLACEVDHDACGLPMLGSCSAQDECECAMNPECLPCLPERCSEYEACPAAWSHGGECVVACSYEFPPFGWDDAIDCAVVLPADAPDVFFDWLYAYLGGFGQVRGRTCDDPRADYLFDLATRALTLCPAACSQLEAGDELIVGWSIPCE